MKCQKCEAETKIITVTKDKTHTERKRECKNCGIRFITEEKLITYKTSKNWEDHEIRSLVYSLEKGLPIDQITAIVSQTKSSINYKKHQLLENGKYFEYVEELGL